MIAVKVSHIVLLCLILLCTNKADFSSENDLNEKPKIAFTFDDGSIQDMPNYKLEEWNQLILENLKKNNIKAVLFATGSFLQGEKGEYVLSSWNEAGHKIGNHTYTHPYYNSKKITIENFKDEFSKNDSIIKKYSNYYPYFRYPYLKEGNTIEKRDGFRDFLKEHNYNIGHVTIDDSDWYINSRLVKRLKENPEADFSGFKEFYIQHLYDRALFYDSIATQLTNRKINHIMLLHHNLTSALFMDDLIQHFKEKGWEIIDANKAFTDEIYQQEPKNIPAGESLIWALAKQWGYFEGALRYPAEDSVYEKAKMDSLGL